MRPSKSLPYSDEFLSADDYLEDLLEFTSSSDLYRFLCGGVHILDFFTSDPGVFNLAVPEEWRRFLLQTEPMALLDLLMRVDLEYCSTHFPDVPMSLLHYVRDIRRLSLGRSFQVRKAELPVLGKSVALGMKVKKIHEVTNFAAYLDELAQDVACTSGKEITHFVDLGSGQNYLGRALASPPYVKNIVAVESKELNIERARDLDVLAGIAEVEKLARNKKVIKRVLELVDPSRRADEEALIKAARMLNLTDEEIATIDLRGRKGREASYKSEGKGFINYVVGRLDNGDLGKVISQIQGVTGTREEDLHMMAVSIHSCGNLSHYGIRSLIDNASIQAVAIVGCCYNLMTEKLCAPTYKLPAQKTSLRELNGRLTRESEKRDPQGFPMSERVSSYKGHGIRLNITARMMACQAPQNWTCKESDFFFTAHFYRAVLQKILLDKGVISRVYHTEDSKPNPADGNPSPFNLSTNPVILGSLGKRFYASFKAYVRGAISKLTSNTEYGQYGRVIQEKMTNITDEEIETYEVAYGPRKRELSSIWSLMAFSACVVESLIVADRYLFLREHLDVVRDCWVEAVFDYRESPRNLAVVGIKL